MRRWLGLLLCRYGWHQRFRPDYSRGLISVVRPCPRCGRSQVVTESWSEWVSYGDADPAGERGP